MARDYKKILLAGAWMSPEVSHVFVKVKATHTDLNMLDAPASI
jgi:hypothetical protein